MLLRVKYSGQPIILNKYYNIPSHYYIKNGFSYVSIAWRSCTKMNVVSVCKKSSSCNIAFFVVNCSFGSCFVRWFKNIHISFYTSFCIFGWMSISRLCYMQWCLSSNIMDWNFLSISKCLCYSQWIFAVTITIPI